jgi:hypothetical protein
VSAPTVQRNGLWTVVQVGALVCWPLAGNPVSGAMVVHYARMRTILLALCLTLASVPTLSSAQRHYTTISGRFVAYSGGLTCINGNASWSWVIRVRRPKNKSPEFVRVAVSAPCDVSMPISPPEKPEIVRFSRLFRMKSCDAALQESRTITDNATEKSSQATPNWTFAPGMENEKLPFGQVVPCYGWDPVPVQSTL